MEVHRPHCEHCLEVVPVELEGWEITPNEPWLWEGDWVRLVIVGPGFPASRLGILPESWGPLFFCSRVHAAEFLVGKHVDGLLGAR